MQFPSPQNAGGRAGSVFVILRINCGYGPTGKKRQFSFRHETLRFSVAYCSSVFSNGSRTSDRSAKYAINSPR